MSERPDFKGDYMGFTYNNIHSSALGIVRTSDGSRFNENLLPTIQDKTVQVPGGDGTYYFGSYYTQRPFTISFAFDSLTEEQVARLKTHFGDKKIHDLIFDETPYKIYSAKVTGTATIKHVPFVEGEANRVYKGEGTIQFTCYTPFARSAYKWLDQYNEDSNKKEWAAASKMKETQDIYDIYGAGEYRYGIELYNPGNLESHFQLRLNFNEEDKIAEGQISIGNDRLLKWSEISAKGEDKYIKINTRINLIEGYNSNNFKSGNIYNKYIIAGDFFKIPLGESTLLTVDTNQDSYIGIEHPIEYNYYYF